MAILPETLRGFRDDFLPVFTRPISRRFFILLEAAILTVGRRTVVNRLRTSASQAVGPSPSYRWILSQARWSSLGLACVLARKADAMLPADDPIILVCVDTDFAHPARDVSGKPRHLDRSDPRMPTPPGGTATSDSCSPCRSVPLRLAAVGTAGARRPESKRGR